MAEIFNLPQKTGSLVQKVVMSSPLGIIGVRGGTIEMEIGGQNIWAGGDIILPLTELRSKNLTKYYYKLPIIWITDLQMILFKLLF
ncbi:MAG: hypothetical protein L3J09_01770 [Flavobacteriaceae bacterium]|nr:hypothetical protein [Flavobacteriaceae bacterium]